MKRLYQFLFGSRESGKTYSMINKKSKRELKDIVLKQNQEIEILKRDVQTLSEVCDNQRDTIISLRKLIDDKVTFDAKTQMYHIFIGGVEINSISKEDYERIKTYVETKRTN